MAFMQYFWAMKDIEDLTIESNVLKLMKQCAMIKLFSGSQTNWALRIIMHQICLF